MTMPNNTYQQSGRKTWTGVPEETRILYPDDCIQSGLLTTQKDFARLIGPETCATISRQTIQPNQVAFGISEEDTLAAQILPLFIFDNSEQIATHHVFLLKRKLTRVSMHSQFHFLNNKLFLVVDEYAAQSGSMRKILTTTMNGYMRHDLPELPLGKDWCIRDSQNHYLLIKDHLTLRAFYYAPELFRPDAS